MLPTLIGPQVGPKCSAQLKAKDGQVCPQSALVGPSAPVSFSFYPILWVRAVLVAKRFELIIIS